MTRKRRKIKRNIRLRQSVRITEKNDATRVQNNDNAKIRRVNVQMPRDNGLNVRIRIKKRAR